MNATRRNVISAAVVFGLTIPAFVMWRSGPDATATFHEEAPPKKSDTVSLTRAAQAKNPIKTARVTRSRLTSDVHVVGSVTYDRNHYAIVGPLVAGRVVTLTARVGDTVRTGQVLGAVESAEVGEAQAAFLSARARAGAAKSNAEREKELAAEHISSAREHELAEAQAASESADVRAATERLRAFGLGAAELGSLEGSAGTGGRVLLRAPIDGIVIARSISLGQAVERATDAFEIADLSRLWVLLDVYEKDLGRVRVGQDVLLRTDASSGEPLHAKIAYMTPLVDERTRTAGARIDLEQQKGAFRPGQFVTAQILGDDGNSEPSLVIARSAVETVDGKAVVFSKSGEGFMPREVTLGLASADRVEIDRGLAEGDEVVVDGAFLLKSELQRQ